MIDAKLEEIMCDHPIKIRAHVRVGSVAHLLLRHQISGILVVKSDNENHLVGILTTTDLLRLIKEALAHGTQRLKALRKIGDLMAGDVATKEIISLQTKDSLLKAIVTMHRKNVHTIPVFNRKKLVGVIGKHDILNAALMS